MKRLKKQYKNKILSNGNVPKFNTNDISNDMILFYEKNGFDWLFEDYNPTPIAKVEKEPKTIKKKSRK